jgi:hypothetical protein
MTKFPPVRPEEARSAVSKDERAEILSCTETICDQQMRAIVGFVILAAIDFHNNNNKKDKFNAAQQ